MDNLLTNLPITQKHYTHPISREDVPRYQAGAPYKPTLYATKSQYYSLKYKPLPLFKHRWAYTNLSLAMFSPVCRCPLITYTYREDPSQTGPTSSGFIKPYSPALLYLTLNIMATIKLRLIRLGAHLKQVLTQLKINKLLFLVFAACGKVY